MNDIAQALARHIREIHFGNNWSDSAMQEVIKDVTWQQAVATPIPSVHSIAVLVFHTNFYLNYVHKSIKEGVYKFDHNDSFKAPPIESETDWQALLKKSWEDAEAFAKMVEKLPENLNLYEVVPPFQNSFYKNIQGIIEHNHYHLGQIVLLKKMV
jgi:DinB superfamily